MRKFLFAIALLIGVIYILFRLVDIQALVQTLEQGNWLFIIPALFTNQGNKIRNGHGSQVFPVPPAWRHFQIVHFPVADDQHVGRLLHLGLPNLVTQLFIGITYAANTF